MKNTILVSLIILINFGFGNSLQAAPSVIHPVNGYTLTSDGLRQFSALAIGDDGKVLATGDKSLLEQYPEMQRVDGKGLTMLPGLIDAHGHVEGLGAALNSLDLHNVPSEADALERIAAHDRKQPGTGWLLGRGWNQVLWANKQFPKAASIDAIVSNRPVWLRRVDGHAGWANSAALSLAGINDDTIDPHGGKILRDRSGHATGVLVDHAMALIDAIIPPPDKDELHQNLLSSTKKLLSEGITSAHEPGIDIKTVEVYLSMADAHELPMRVYIMLSGAGENLDALGAPIQSYGDDRVTVASVKIYDDGALGSRGAALIEPYSDDPENSGLLFADANQLAKDVRKANDAGFQVGIHAIGDLANRAALDAFDDVQGGKPSPLRNRIEHAQVIALEDIPRFASLGIIAAMQATHATSDKNMAEDRLGPERIKGAYAWRRLLDSGAIIAGGSDFPVEYSNPFLGLYASVTRQDGAGEPAGGWYGDQTLTREEALNTFTLAAAYAAHQEDRLGSLEAGKWADFIIIDRDYFKIPASKIDDIKVIETWVAGKKVFAADDDEQETGSEEN